MKPKIIFLLLLIFPLLICVFFLRNTIYSYLEYYFIEDYRKDYNVVRLDLGIPLIEPYFQCESCRFGEDNWQSEKRDAVHSKKRINRMGGESSELDYFGRNDTFLIQATIFNKDSTWMEYSYSNRGNVWENTHKSHFDSLLAIISK